MRTLEAFDSFINTLQELVMNFPVKEMTISEELFNLVLADLHFYLDNLDFNGVKVDKDKITELTYFGIVLKKG